MSRRESHLTFGSEFKSLQRPAYTSGNLYAYMFTDGRLQYLLTPGSRPPTQPFIQSFMNWWKSIKR